MQEAVNVNPNILGIGVLFEENAFDGQDAAFVNTQYADETGRLMPYITPSGGGFLTGWRTAKWYTVPKETHKAMVGDPYTFKGNGKDMMAAPLAVPIMSNGQFIGVVLLDMDMGTFQGDLEQVSTTEDYYTLFSGSGLVVANGVNKDAVMKNVFEEMKLSKDQIAHIFDKDMYAIEKVSPVTGKDSIYIYSPIVFDGTDDQWAFLSVTDYDLFVGSAKQMIYYSIGIAVFFIILIVSVLLFFVKRRLTEPMEVVSQIIENFAAYDFREEKNKTVRRYMDRSDEIGGIANDLKKMGENLRNMLRKIHSSSQSVAATSEELTATTQNTAESATRVADTIREIAGGAEQQSTDTQNASGNVEEIMQLVEKNDAVVHALSRAVAVIDERKREGAGSLSRMEEKSAEVDDAMRRVVDVVVATNQNAERIEKASQMIQAISEQTNLLSLNAAIEAARAGESGRGFSVVADEIRKLAEESKGFSEEIKEVIEELMVKSQAAVDTMKISSAITEENAKELKNTSEQFSQIAEAVDEAHQVMDDLQKTYAVIRQKNESVAGMVQNLSAIAEENAAATGDADAQVDAQTKSLQDIAEASEDLANIATELQATVEQFKI